MTVVRPPHWQGQNAAKCFDAPPMNDEDKAAALSMLKALSEAVEENRIHSISVAAPTVEVPQVYFESIGCESDPLRMIAALDFQKAWLSQTLMESMGMFQWVEEE